uniref:Uncharacterized protein n=1 Tax=Megaselia scalaris TaxID=36166 RepID=T1GNI9_MEGSC
MSPNAEMALTILTITSFCNDKSRTAKWRSNQNDPSRRTACFQLLFCGIQQNFSKQSYHNFHRCFPSAASQNLEYRNDENDTQKRRENYLILSSTDDVDDYELDRSTSDCF